MAGGEPAGPPRRGGVGGEGSLKQLTRPSRPACAAVRAGAIGVAAHLGARLVLACAGLACMPPAQAQALSALYLKALASDPGVAGAQAQLQAAEQRVAQARAGFGPQVQLTINSTENRYSEAPAYDMRPFHSTTHGLQVTQPLLKLSLFPALQAAQAQQAQAEATLEQARAEAAQRLVEACFELLKARDTVALSEAQRVATAEQLASARRAWQVGTAAITDVREAEAKADVVSAQLLAAQADLLLRQQVVAELVGDLPADGLADLLGRGFDGSGLPPLQPADALAWLTGAQAGSPQLRQSREALEAAEAEVRRAWHGHAPTIDLSYNYTSSSDTGTVTSVFPRKGDTSAVGINLTVPLFASGATQARVREAMAQRDKAAADVELARRTVTLGVRQGFSAALSAAAQARALELAQRSQQVSLQANRRGYEVGMKVNADVLEAQSKLFEVRRDLAKARYDAWLAWARLKALGGQLGVAELATIDALLVPGGAPGTPLPARAAPASQAGAGS